MRGIHKIVYVFKYIFVCLFYKKIVQKRCRCILNDINRHYTRKKNGDFTGVKMFSFLFKYVVDEYFIYTTSDCTLYLPAQINPLTSDIIIVIDGSEKFGEIDATGKIFWNPLVAEFLIQFISQVTLGPKGNRVGVVIVSFGIDDMIALTHDKNFLLQSLNNLRPTFTGGCTGKGIATASNLFFQYGRPTAVKRVVHLTDGSPLCSYSSMHEGKYARKCGIDIVNVVIGKTVRPPLDQLSVQSQWLLTGKESFQIIWQSLLKRMFLSK